MTEPLDKMEERCWEVGFEGHEDAQRRRMAAMTFRQKLEWLEEAHLMVIAMQQDRRERDGEK